MKAKELLRRYADGRRDFRGENLRGQSFKGKDLSGADFSKADIRGANFTNATLKNTKFNHAQAGLDHPTKIFLLIGLFLISALIGFMFVFCNALLGSFFISYLKS
ncbi:pentapeptide repeat-containing protein [Planktothricoides sp. SR001]|uniref:pentapeptide repeat-containing protein n=1 Tax=Planktothricoides sp. SR001 TaxID=1705388 RepID=UPI0006C879F3|nr:pentapeptide repeat-containing protein [Planktothricoides sp. SR001]